MAPMKHILLILATALLALPAQAQSFTGFLRSITNAASTPKEPEKSQTTATIGVRGMDEANAQGAAADHEELRMLESWSASKVEAENSAGKRGLVAKNASYGDVEEAK